MENVIDVQSSGRPEILDRATTDGLIGQTRRLQQPLARHLLDSETPRYLAYNDRRGVTAEGRDTQDLAPTGDYRAFLVATTVRVLFVVGDADGDRTVSLPYEDVVAVETTSGLRTSTLAIVTTDGDRWGFDCKGDLDPVRTFVDEAEQRWTRALTEIDRAQARAEDATDALDDGDLDTAATRTRTAQEALDSGRWRIRTLDEAATAAVDDRLESTQRRIDTCQRRRHREAGDEYREAARRAWDDRAYERAADAYAQANVEYERALAVKTPQPSTDTIEAARTAVAREYTELLSAPVDAAQTAASEARAASDPGVAAEHWETALDRYRTAHELDWGRDRRFDGDRASLKQALVDAAVELVDAHREAGRQCLHVSGGESDHEASGDTLDDARGHLERAREVATELVPDRRDPPAADVVAATEQLARVGSE